MNAEFTAKDFRTWGATVRAFELMLNTPLPELPTKRALMVFSAWQKGILHGCMQEQSEGNRKTLECIVPAFFPNEEATRANAEPHWHDC